MKPVSGVVLNNRWKDGDWELCFPFQRPAIKKRCQKHRRLHGRSLYCSGGRMDSPYQLIEILGQGSDAKWRTEASFGYQDRSGILFPLAGCDFPATKAFMTGRFFKRKLSAKIARLQASQGFSRHILMPLSFPVFQFLLDDPFRSSLGGSRIIFN